MVAKIFNGVDAGLGEGASAIAAGLSGGEGLGDSVGATVIGDIAGDGTGEFSAVGGGVVQLTINKDATIAPIPVRITVL